jgi:hypothetical protein
MAPSGSASKARLSFEGGRYVVRGEINVGHFSRIYEAYDVERDARVALKVLSVAGTHRAIAEAMFRKEVGALEGVTHPAIVKLERHFEDREHDALVIVLELIPGGRNLQELLNDVTAGRRPEPSLQWRVQQLARLLGALELAHARGIVHRDVKPANVLIDEDEQLRLADFGIARVFENYGRGVEAMTLRDFFTRPYAAPEQVLRREAAPAADLHAFSVLSIAVLSLRLPDEDFDEQTARGTLRALRSKVAEPLADRVEDLLVKGIDADPRRRPHGHEFVEAFEALLAGVAARAPAWVRFADSARDGLRRCGFDGPAAVLDDLNRDLRAVYAEPADKSGAPRPTVTAYGQHLEVKLVPTREDAERLLAVSVARVQPSLLNKRRQQAVSMPFLLSLGDGTAAPLIEAAFAAFDATRQEQQAVAKVRELFDLGRFMLERQRGRLVHLRVRCRVADGANAGHGGGRRRRRRSGRAIDGNVQLKVVDVRPWDDPDGGSDDLPLRWVEGMDEKSSFSVRGRRVGRFRGFDAARQVLSVRWDVPTDVDGVVDLEFKDIALETSLNRQEAALRAVEAGTTTNPRLRELLVDPSKSYVERVEIDDLIQKNLTPPVETRQLIERMLGAQELFLLQGPPGTGKTTLIAEFVGQLLRLAPRTKVLLVSQTHDAVDNALERLEELAREGGLGWRLVRDLSPEAQASGRRGFESSFRAWVERVRARSHQAWTKQSSDFSAEQRTIVGAALESWREKLDQASDVREDFASSIQVMATTCLRAPAVLKQLRDAQFDWAVVDEAAKATATEVLVPLVVARRALLVGDHRQLPPFLDTETATDLRSAGHDVDRAKQSLFEELFSSVPPSNRATLRVQYRMHRSIGSFVGDLYYSDIGGLETGVPDEARTIDVPQLDGASRVFWVDVDGRVAQDGTSSYNVAEMQAVQRVVALLSRERAAPVEVAVISPYLAQVRRIRDMSLRGNGVRVVVATVNAFQGRQVDVVVYSFVKDNLDAGRFVTDPRRLNVAFSRCKRALVLVGSVAAARKSAALAPVVRAIPNANIVRGGF